MKIGDGEVKFLLTTWGSSAGQILRLELDREKQLTIPFDQLGMLPIQAQTLKDALENVVGGVVLVLVPPTHGLTTLGYALLTQHNAYTSDIKTIERQVDRRLEGVTQLAWIAGEATNEYSTALQSIVRRGPNVMLVSDITDPGTGPILTHANSQNTLFYVLIPTDSVTIGLSTYLKAVGDPKSAANSSVLWLPEDWSENFVQNVGNHSKLHQTNQNVLVPQEQSHFNSFEQVARFK